MPSPPANRGLAIAATALLALAGCSSAGSDTTSAGERNEGGHCGDGDDPIGAGRRHGM